MRKFAAIAGLASVAFGLWALAHTVSDIQIGLVATGLIGGIALLTLSSVLEKLERLLERRTDPDA